MLLYQWISIGHQIHALLILFGPISFDRNMQTVIHRPTKLCSHQPSAISHHYRALISCKGFSSYMLWCFISYFTSSSPRIFFLPYGCNQFLRMSVVYLTVATFMGAFNNKIKSSRQHWNVIFLFICCGCVLLFHVRMTVFEIFVFFLLLAERTTTTKNTFTSTKSQKEHNQCHLSSSTPWLPMTNSGINQTIHFFTCALSHFHFFFYVSSFVMSFWLLLHIQVYDTYFFVIIFCVSSFGFISGNLTIHVKCVCSWWLISFTSCE